MKDVLHLQERVLLPAGPWSRVLLGCLQKASIEVAQASGEPAAVPTGVHELRPEVHSRDVGSAILQLALPSGRPSSEGQRGVRAAAVRMHRPFLS